MPPLQRKVLLLRGGVDELGELIRDISTGVKLPKDVKVRVENGTYTPLEEGTDVLHTIRIQNKRKPVSEEDKYYIPICFLIFQGTTPFTNTISQASSSIRPLILYIGLHTSFESSSVSYGDAGGLCIFKRDGISHAAVRQTSNTYSGWGGIPTNYNTLCSNSFIRRLANDYTDVVFSSYGLICLAKNTLYHWYAFFLEK